MTFTPGRLTRLRCWAACAPLAALAACSAPWPATAVSDAPMAASAGTVTGPTLGTWPAPAAPLDLTAIGPVETVGAAANE
jgi:hypothetical protein